MKTRPRMVPGLARPLAWTGVGLIAFGLGLTCLIWAVTELPQDSNEQVLVGVGGAMFGYVGFMAAVLFGIDVVMQLKRARRNRRRP